MSTISMRPTLDVIFCRTVLGPGLGCSGLRAPQPADISSSWGVEHPDEPDQYTHVRPEDVNEVVRQLEGLLGATRAEVANKASPRNKFGSGSAPWQDIWAGDGMRDLADFIRRHLGGLVAGE